MASPSNIKIRSASRQAIERRPREPVVYRAGGTQSSMWKMDADEEIHWGRRKYKACLKRFAESSEYYVMELGEAVRTQFNIRNIAQKLIRSAFQHLNPVEERLKRMTWRIDFVLGGDRTQVKGYPGGGLMVFPGDKRLLVDLQEDEVAVLLASAIVNILLRSDAEKYLQARALDEYRFIPQVVKPYLTKLRSVAWERERVFLKDQMILLTMEGAGYDRQSIFDWYEKVQLPPFYNFFQPSHQCRARRLHAWSTKARAPMISVLKDESSDTAGRKWYPGGKHDDMPQNQIQFYRSTIKDLRKIVREEDQVLHFEELLYR